MLALSCVLARRWHGSIRDGDSDLSSHREKERERERERDSVVSEWTGYFRYRRIQRGFPKLSALMRDVIAIAIRILTFIQPDRSKRHRLYRLNRNIFQYFRYFDIKSIFPGFLRHYYACHVMAHYIFSCMSYDNWNIPYGVYSFRPSRQSRSFLSFDSYLCFISICLVHGIHVLKEYDSREQYQVVVSHNK